MTDTEGTLCYFVFIYFFFIFISSNQKNSYHYVFNHVYHVKLTNTIKFSLFSAPAAETQPQKTAAAPVQKEIIGE